MPQPGSKAYENQRREQRDRYEEQGVQGGEATDAANKDLQGGRRTGSDAMATARVDGPAGERDGRRGDPGAKMMLRSSAFSDGAPIPDRYARDGDDTPPPVEWGDVPEGTAELALLLQDPDAQEGPFCHWLVTSIEPTVTGLAESVPADAHVWPNDFGETGYGGPHPPAGDEPHRYRLRLYALAEPLGLKPGADRDEAVRTLEERALATGTLTGTFVR